MKTTGQHTMRLEDYTPDAICRSMGLPSFVESSWANSDQPTLRLLLKPSFDPELILTVSQAGDSTALTVAALGESFWRNGLSVILPHEREDAFLPREVFAELVALFQSAQATHDPTRRFVVADGMGFCACLVSRAVRHELHEHVSNCRGTEKLAARSVEIAFHACRRLRVCRALAQAGLYVNLKLPLPKLTPAPAITRLAILGAPQEREEYFKMLQQHTMSKADRVQGR